MKSSIFAVLLFCNLFWQLPCLGSQACQLDFEVVRDQNPVARIQLTARDSHHLGQPAIQIVTQVSTRNVLEKNITWLTADHQILAIDQRSDNPRDGQEFTWQVTRQNGLGTVNFHNRRTNDTTNRQFTFPANGYSLQPLIYLMLFADLNQFSAQTYKLLIPPDMFFDIQLTKTGREQVLYQGKSITCYKVKIGLTGILGFFTPVTWFWIAVDAPHLPLKYVQGNTTTRLVSDRITE